MAQQNKKQRPLEYKKFEWDEYLVNLFVSADLIFFAIAAITGVVFLMTKDLIAGLFAALVLEIPIIALRTWIIFSRILYVLRQIRDGEKLVIKHGKKTRRN